MKITAGDRHQLLAVRRPNRGDDILDANIGNAQHTPPDGRYMVPGGRLHSAAPYLLAVWNPDIFHLRGLAQEFLAFALLDAQPVARMPVADPGAFHVACRGKLNALAALLRAEVPHGIYVIVVGQHLAERVAVTRYDVDHPGGQIRCLENLVEVRCAQRRALRWNRHDGIAHSDSRGDQRDEAEQGILVGTGHADYADSLRHRQHRAAHGRPVNRALVLVAPRRVAEEA